MNVIEKNELISVIVPIYNTEKYLEECIKSIVVQTYTNLEILLIVDGSTDNSTAICKKWQDKDGRIKLFVNDNRGVSFTRNFGLQNCTGEYVVFIDSDDVIAPNYVEFLYRDLKNRGSDLATVCHSSFLDGKAPIYTEESGIYTHINNLYELILKQSNGFVWGKLYIMAIIRENQISFDSQILICEDLLFNLEYVRYAKVISCNKSKLYGYRQRAGSAIHNTVSLKWFSCLDAYRMILDRYGDTSVRSDIVFQYLKNLYEAKYHIKHNKIDNVEIRQKVFPEIKKVEKMRNCIDIKRRIKLWICKYLFFIVIKKRKRKEKIYA